MIVKVEACYGSHYNFSFRLTLPDGRREFITGETWTRDIAIIAKDRISNLYHVERDAIRFDHH